MENKLIKIEKIEKTYERDNKTGVYYRYAITDEKGTKAYVKPLDETSREILEKLIEETKENK